MDADWKSVRDYTPWVKSLPSEYIRKHIRFGCQPMEQPPTKKDLHTFLKWLHADEILVYASEITLPGTGRPRRAFYPALRRS